MVFPNESEKPLLDAKDQDNTVDTEQSGKIRVSYYELSATSRWKVQIFRRLAFIRRIQIVLSILSLCLILFASLQYKAGLLVGQERDPAYDVYNRTLGFQKVYVIGFPERTDKRDAVTIASSFTGFDVDWVDGVAVEDFSPKAVPSEWNSANQAKGALGCWRAHMNVMRKIVAEGVQSALIFEDDADWDVSLKDQLLGLAHGIRALTSQEQPTESPYGDGWDFLWTGQCMIGPSDTTTKFYVFENDTSVAPLQLRHGRWRNFHVPQEIYQSNTRLLFKANGGVCTYSYAVSYESARKILSQLSLQSTRAAIDLEYMKMCDEGNFLSCYGVYPPITSSHRFRGSQERDSDISGKSNRRHGEYSMDIVYSAIMNAHRMAAGEDTVLAQWPDKVRDKEIDRYKHRQVYGGLRHINLLAYNRTYVKGVNI